MAREVDLMRRELKKHVLPKLAELGFTGKGLDFQRRRERLDLLAIQYWKYGVEFILEFASFDRGGLQTTWGSVVPEEKITVAHTPVLQRARLEQLGPEAGKYLRGFVRGLRGGSQQVRGPGAPGRLAPATGRCLAPHRRGKPARASPGVAFGPAVGDGSCVNFLYALIGPMEGVHWQEIKRTRRTAILLRLDEMGIVLRFRLPRARWSMSRSLPDTST